MDAIRIQRVSNTALDGMRGVFALVVCFAHSWQTLINPQYGPYHWDHAMLGLAARFAVDAFYVLSGWVICQSVRTNIQRNGGFDGKDWAANRFFRIATPLGISILVTIFIWQFVRIVHLDGTNTAFGLARVQFDYRYHDVLLGLVTLGFKGDLTGGMNGPLWSLSIEIQLYFLTFMFFWLRTKHSFLSLLVIAVALWRMTLDANILLGYGAFVTGFHASRLVSNKNFRFAGAPAIKYTGLTVSVGAAAWMFFSFHIDSYYLDHLADWPSIRMQLVFALGFAMFLLGAPEFESNVLAKTGNFSYTLYIVHFPLLLLLSYFLYKYTILMGNPAIAWSIWFVGAMLAVFVASKIGNWVERPKAQKAWVRDKLITYQEQRAPR